MANIDLTQTLQAIKGVELSDVLQSRQARTNLLALSRKLTAAIEDPVDRATDLVFKPYTSIVARIAVDLQLFVHIASESTPITSQKLAAITNADELLLSRILRLLASADFVENPEEDKWAANDTTRAMTVPSIAAGHRFVYDALVSSMIMGPKFLRESGYKVPVEPTDTMIQYAKQTRLKFFDYLQTKPSMFHDFNLFMGNTMGAREYWHEWYDVKGRLLEGFDQSKDSTLLVDVGGGKGHDLQAFYSSFSDPSWKDGSNLVLQDLPQVLVAIPESELPASVKKMPHDFFEEQPVKGARGYFLHHVLHDWSDKYCQRILQNLRRAMIPGYSKLLVHELILPNTGAVEIQARFDMVMMTLNGGMERSRSQWINLLESSGFCNIRIFENSDQDGIVEAEAAYQL